MIENWAKKMLGLAAMLCGAVGSQVEASLDCTYYPAQYGIKAVFDISQSAIYGDLGKSTVDFQATLDDALKVDVGLINDPVYRVLRSYAYLLDDNFPATIAHAEAAQRLSIRRSDCYLQEILDLTQAIRIAAAKRYLPNGESRVIFDGVVAFLPDSEENLLVNTADVICAAFGNMFKKNPEDDLIKGKSCTVRRDL